MSLADPFAYTPAMKKAKTTAKSEGVPRETPERNTLDILRKDLSQSVSAKQAKTFVTELVKEGYFDKSLLEQKRAIVAKLGTLPSPDRVIDGLLKSNTDRLRSYAVSYGRVYYEDKLEKILGFLYRVGALPGSWTQETAQSELKIILHKYGVKTVLPKVAKWVSDKKPEIRRMVIEALRPRGVWCAHLSDLKADPTPIKDLLVRLLDDNSDYVRKAVANNLNDISKDNPDLLCKWVAEWSKGSMCEERKWIINRALRTLIKNGHPKARQLLGFGDAHQVKVSWKRGTSKTVEIGDQIPFEFTLENLDDSEIKCRLQLEIHGPGKGNKPRIAKYILGDMTLTPGETRAHSKKVRFEDKNSVSKLPGKYEMHLYLNGAKLGSRSFTYSE